MNLPKKLTFLIALILVVVGVLCELNVINVAFLDNIKFWLVTAGFALLALACMFKGL